MNGNYNYGQTSVSGINAQGLRKLSLDMITYEEDFQKIFSELQNIMNQTKAIFDGEAGNQYRKNFDNFSTNFKVITNSMKNYSEDFISVIKQYEKRELQQQNWRY
ncbi:MAG: hypothetical protein HFG40_03055 [Bacilli bacterium]|nr:hypothetical protein [Bacilli bacterium]